MKKIGFIGVGIMGKSMVRNLMKAGYEVAIYTRTRSKVEDIIGEGAIWCGSAGECAKGRQAVISIVGYPKDVEDIYFGEGGIIANADPGTYLIDMTTTSPRLAVRIYEEAKKAGLHALDAPVTGKILTPVKASFRPWVKILIMKVRQETDSTPRCVTRLRLREPWQGLVRQWSMPGMWGWMWTQC